MSRYHQYPVELHPLCGTREIVVFDLETTGLRPQFDEITQIAGIRLGGLAMETNETFSTFVNPGRPMPSLATRITRISDKDVSTAPAPQQALAAFSEFAEGAVLLGHDIYRFDFPFIRKHLQSIATRTVSFIDTMDVFELLWPGFSRLRNSLDDIADRFSISIPKKLRHRADGDALILARIYQKLQLDPRLQEVASHVPVHEAKLPTCSPFFGLN